MKKRPMPYRSLYDLHAGREQLNHLATLGETYDEIQQYLDSWRRDMLDGLDQDDPEQMMNYLENAENNLNDAMCRIQALRERFQDERTLKEVVLFQQQRMVDVLTQT